MKSETKSAIQIQQEIINDGNDPLATLDTFKIIYESVKII